MSRAHLAQVSLAELAPQEVVGGPVEWGPETPGQIIERHGQAGEQAVMTLLRLRDVEAAVTGEFLDALPEGARADGLQWRVKSPVSLARKIADRVALRSLTPEEAARRCTDVLRYTAVVASPERLVVQTQELVAGLLAKGWRVLEAEQSYTDDQGQPAVTAYKGLHLILARGAGGEAVEFAVEVQAHSQESIAAKDEGHRDYELERDRDVLQPQRAAAWYRMAARWAQVATPPGLVELEELGGVAVRVKSYGTPYATS